MEPFQRDPGDTPAPEFSPQGENDTKEAVLKGEGRGRAIAWWPVDPPSPQRGSVAKKQFVHLKSASNLGLFVYFGFPRRRIFLM